MSPDTFRLRYRQARSEAMKAIVHQFQSPAWETVMATIPPSVAEEDHDTFVKLVLEEFENLYEGNAIRFGIRPLEFAVGRKKSNNDSCSSGVISCV